MISLIVYANESNQKYNMAASVAAQFDIWAIFQCSIHSISFVAYICLHKLQ